MDRGRSTQPLDRAFDETAAMHAAGVVDVALTRGSSAAKRAVGHSVSVFAPVRSGFSPSWAGNALRPACLPAARSRPGISSASACQWRASSARPSVAAASAVHNAPAEIPHVVADDMVFAVPQEFAVGGSGGQEAGETAIRRGLGGVPSSSTPPPATIGG
jgi:hypothetical protein